MPTPEHARDPEPASEPGTDSYAALRSSHKEKPSTLPRLQSAGLHAPASPPTPWPEHSGGPQYTDAQVDALLDEMKGEH